MRRYVPSLPVSAKTLRRDWSKPMARMTTSIFSWNIRRKWRSLNWSIVSRAYPPAVSGSYILRLLGGTTRVCCGHRVTLLPHVEAHRYLSFGSTLKTKEKTCERCALSALYLRPQTAELYGTCGKLPEGGNFRITQRGFQTHPSHICCWHNDPPCWCTSIAPQAVGAYSDGWRYAPAYDGGQENNCGSP